jgi:hypothetical protein
MYEDLQTTGSETWCETSHDGQSTGGEAWLKAPNVQ